MIAQKINIKNSLSYKALFLVPATMIVAATACFLPAVFLIILFGALFHYFWNNKDKIILFLLIYTPFEEFILKSLTYDLYLVARYAWEGALLSMMALILIQNLALRRTWKKSPIDLFALLFLLTWLASTFVNDISPTFSAMHLKNIIRYVPVFYLIYNLELGSTYIKTILRIIIAVAIIQSIICIGQAIEGDVLIKAFESKDLVIDGKALREYNYDKGYYQYQFTGSMGANINLGNYLSFALCFLAAGAIIEKRSSKYFIPIALTLTALILSSSRVSLIAAFIGIGVILFKVKSRVRFIYFIAPVLAALVLFSWINFDNDNVYSPFNIYKRFAYLFTSDYFDTTTTFNRGYVLLYEVPRVLATSPALGLGPGTFQLLAEDIFDEQTYGKAASLGLDPSGLKYVRDVGYAAILTQVGLVGLLIFGLIFYKVFKAASEVYDEVQEKTIRIFMLGAIGFLVALAVENVAVFSFIYRNQSLLIWTVCGVVALYASARKTQNKAADISDSWSRA